MCLSVETNYMSLIGVSGVSEAMSVVCSIFCNKNFMNPSFNKAWKQLLDCIMMGKLLLLLSHKEKIIGTKTTLLLQAVLKITFIIIVAIMWWNSVGLLMWKPLCFSL